MRLYFILQGRIPPTKEEQLMMERKRMTPSGISSYEFHEESSTFVFSASSSLFCCKDLVSLKDSVRHKCIRTLSNYS